MSENQNGLDDTIGIYNNAFNKIITNVTNYLDRSDKYKNPYLGKNITSYLSHISFFHKIIRNQFRRFSWIKNRL